MNTILLLILAQISLCTTNSLLTSTGQEEQYCASFDGMRCHQCYVSFLNPNNQCQVPNNKVDRCTSYLNDQRCVSCQFNYHLVNNECVRVNVDRCVKQIGDRCDICGEGLLVNEQGNCEIDRHCGDVNCSYCYLNQGQDNCAICRPGYVLSGPNQDVFLKQVCVLETPMTRNCLMLDKSQMKCQICQLNYYQDANGVCVQSDAYHIDLLGFSNNLLAGFVLIFSFIF